MIFDVIPLTQAEEETVLESVGYSRERLSTDLLSIREWLEQQHHLPSSRLKGSLERAKLKLDSYYSWRRKSTIFAERDPTSPRLVESDENIDFTMMPKALPSGHRLSVMRFKSSNGFNMLDTMRKMTFMIDLGIRCPGITAGDHIVIDCARCHSGYLSAINPILLKDIVQYIQSSIPKRSHCFIINCSPAVEVIFNQMLKPFMNKKMAERFVVTKEGHKFVQDLYPLDVIPVELGGCGPSIDSIQGKYHKAIKALTTENQEFFSGLQELTDEKKRPTQSKVDESIFGVQGSIKTLAID